MSHKNRVSGKKLLALVPYERWHGKSQIMLQTCMGNAIGSVLGLPVFRRSTCSRDLATMHGFNTIRGYVVLLSEQFSLIFNF
jgi:hypothetical protein